ncbi:cytochrome c oxidase assembly protein COX19 isoform X1 [Suricata suricatta]|uniref:Cytochrome c oxidase assembly protein COX19 n=1 Tax=Suricata suricatta TaxID=37032 RepID=A0A673TIA4_SURSU|nr:cytochrome c oxidase assembly protein COX19 isoform X1 [Suricata suricatta]
MHRHLHSRGTGAAIMSTAMNFGSKSFQPRPPDKGSFPLDHFGECKSFKEKFMKCLRDNRFENALCRNESKDYLECRMQRRVEWLTPGAEAGLLALKASQSWEPYLERARLRDCIPPSVFSP